MYKPYHIVSGVQWWICVNCGALARGCSPPTICPICNEEPKNPEIAAKNSAIADILEIIGGKIK